jgi:hypothetical protein
VACMKRSNALSSRAAPSMGSSVLCFYDVRLKALDTTLKAARYDSGVSCCGLYEAQ